MMVSIDDEWKQFLMQQNNDDGSNWNPIIIPNISSDDSEVDSENESTSDDDETKIVSKPAESIRNPCEELYISTQTQIFFLNIPYIDVEKIFWDTTILDYGSPNTGVLKKQMRIVCDTKEEFNLYQEKLKVYSYYTEKIMKQIDNPKARKIKYRDVRKLTIGISKKDIMNCHGKNKNAFINCFAMIIRVKFEKKFHEIHVKVFNTGKMAIPGIVNEQLLEETKIILLGILQPHFTESLVLIPADESPMVKRLIRGKKGKGENEISTKSHFEYVQPKGNVLINSNFNCGYYILQEKLKRVLRDKYKLNPSYDPTMYPGVKCKFFYNNTLELSAEQTGYLCDNDQTVTMTELDELVKEKYTKVSFMIFRTGNVLIVGNCSKPVLCFVFEFVKNILMTEYEEIKASQDIPVLKLKKKKPRKKTISFSRSYYDTIYEKSINT